MIRNYFLLLLFILGLGACANDDDEIIIGTPQIENRNTHFLRGNYEVIAHRGIWIDGVSPENSTHSVYMARKYGFKMVECDVRRTVDGTLVILHDETINRTMRNASDYSKIIKQIKISSISYNDLQNNYVLASNIEKYRTPIPTLEEYLIACRENNIFPLLHITWTTYTDAFILAQSILGNNWCCFTNQIESALNARKISNCLILYSNNETSANVVNYLEQIGGWCGYSTRNIDILTPEFVGQLRAKGWEIQSSIPSILNSIPVIRNGITMLLSDYNINLRDNTRAIEFTDKNTFNDFETDGIINGGKLLLLDGMRVSKVWNKPILYGGVEIEIRYKGSINVNINGSDFNGITRDNMGFDKISLRFSNKAPSVTIMATQETTIKELIVRMADF